MAASLSPKGAAPPTTTAQLAGFRAPWFVRWDGRAGATDRDRRHTTSHNVDKSCGLRRFARSSTANAGPHAWHAGSGHAYRTDLPGFEAGPALHAAANGAQPRVMRADRQRDLSRLYMCCLPCLVLDPTLAQRDGRRSLCLGAGKMWDGLCQGRKCGPPPNAHDFLKAEALAHGRHRLVIIGESFSGMLLKMTV